METLFRIINEELGGVLKTNKKVFVIVKPGSLDLSNTIIERITDAGWKLAMSKTKQLLLSEAKYLYKVHKKEKWYEPLCKYMASGPSMGLIFTKEGLSAPKDFKEIAEIKDKVREEFGESDMRNVMHSSDNLKNASREAAVYFNTSQF